MGPKKLWFRRFFLHLYWPCPFAMCGKKQRSGGEAAPTPQQSEAATSDAQRDWDAGPVATALCCRVREAPREARSRSCGEAAPTPQQSEAATSDSQRSWDAGPVATAL